MPAGASAVLRNRVLLQIAEPCQYAADMGEQRGEASRLKGRLADVYVPTLVDGSLAELSRRLGSRAIVDDPRFGRASTSSSIDPMLERASAFLRDAKASYRHVASCTGIDRDVSEGVLALDTDGGRVETPIAVVAERRRLREIEVRLYYATGSGQATTRSAAREGSTELPQIVAHALDALRVGAVERVLAAFEESSRALDPHGRAHAKRDGSLASFVDGLHRRFAAVTIGAADDGRRCIVETVTRREGSDDGAPAAFTFERGDSGLIRELRCYYEP